MKNLWRQVRRFVGFAQPDGPLRWQTLTEAKETDFFRWFSFTQDGTATNEQGNHVVSFRPSGEKFRLLVKLDAILDQWERIEILRLHLAASFVDDLRDGLFARDIAKSFLLSAVPECDKCSIEGLANEIVGRHSFPVITRSPAPELPSLPSAFFLAFVGHQPRHEESYSSITVTIERFGGNAGNEIVMTMGPAVGNHGSSAGG